MIVSTTTGVLATEFGHKGAIKMIADAGFDAYDFAFYGFGEDSPIFQEDYKQYATELKAHSDMCGIICNQAHAPFPSSVGVEEKDEKIYQNIVRSMEVASILGAKIIVVHPVQHLTYAEHPQELFEMNVAFYKSLIPYCEKFKIKVAIENMWQYNSANKYITDSTCSRAWEFCKYIDAVDSEWIVGCLDVGHASLVVKDIPKFIRELGNKRLQSLHIHDTDFVDDMHTLPFTQKIDYLSVMKELSEIQYEGDFTYEADQFLKTFPKELYPGVLTFMCTIGKYLTSQTKEV